MNAFTLLLILFATLISPMNQGNVSAMPIDVGSHVSPVSELPNGYMERDTAPLIVHDGRTTFVRPVTHSATAYQAPTPPLLPEAGQTSNENADNKTSFKMHPATVMVLLMVTPFAACIVFYPVFILLSRRRVAARNSKKPVSVGEKEKPGTPGTPTSPYLNNPRLAPLPAYPQMVYVPPATQDGTRPIFGHIRSPSGNHVFGVMDRWVIAEEGAEEHAQMNRSTDSLLVREV